MDETDEALVDAAVGGELGVERGGQDVALLDEDGEAVAFGENGDAVAGFHNAWGANIDHFEGTAGELGVGGLNSGVDLAAVSVALDGGVEDAEALLRRVRDFRGEEDASGAGSEGGLGADEVLKRGEEAIALEKFQESGGFAAGDDEAVDGGEFFGLADEDGFRAGFAEGLGVRVVVALEGEDAYAWDVLFGVS